MTRQPESIFLSIQVLKNVQKYLTISILFDKIQDPIRSWAIVIFKDHSGETPKIYLEKIKKNHQQDYKKQESPWILARKYSWAKGGGSNVELAEIVHGKAEKWIVGTAWKRRSPVWNKLFTDFIFHRWNFHQFCRVHGKI